MAQFRKNIIEMSSYSPPLEGRSSKGYLLLDFNEMTIEPSPKVKKALHDFVDSGVLQQYPAYAGLSVAIAEYAGCLPQEVLVTNGSDQGIEVVMRAFVDLGDKVIIPGPSFAMFTQAAQVQGADILSPQYQGDNLDFPFQEVMQLLLQKPKLLILCNPNNPTGGILTLEQVEVLVKEAARHNVAVLHDEAYVQFSGISAVPLVSQYDNLFVSRTFSKQFGLASLRIGCVMSQDKNIEELLKVRGPYDVNMAAAMALKAALQDVQYFENYAKEVMEVSKPQLEEFLTQHNITFYPSKANFLLVKVENPIEITEQLKQQGILVRPRENLSAVRVSIGTKQDTKRFIQAYTALLW